MANDTDARPVPPIAGMIHRPGVPAHMMRIAPARRRITVLVNGVTLAESDGALRLVEIGRDVYPPAYYLPLADVRVELVPTDRSTHCPLKGDTTYHDWRPGDGAPAVADVAWVYDRPLPHAGELAGRVAFDPARATIVDAPLGAVDD